MRKYERGQRIDKREEKKGLENKEVGEECGRKEKKI